ncbi:TPA: hypothetical protein UM344_001239 [Stenotrophomonas maltophilia]|uniref:hypothetical protein n=1 Tax=Stenotrophomonas sp. SMYL28 TaxID=3076049 RepID=UPI002A94767D|nr:hypothetical protein [Stenotrophomonas sp. SMYL28]HEL3246024.1 hypothetical protein [Stenotrophomonas maltophilia]HEL4247997.1 hypothetical protein [Stenotrophomonas maltophilia]HEL4251649.1 hypothetical protein [Stenotrophomonas maltophilia]HEL7612335.1 hypothetical protein [Stenotrophomonas maltophilia]HEL7760371.1 hypothetical protein [Stenotrophomonas maltophilia]
MDTHDQIKLRCPKCRKEGQDQRRDTDYPETHTVEIICNDCDDGDFHSEDHYNAAGVFILPREMP